MSEVRPVRTRRRVVVDHSLLARTIGGRIRQARRTAGLTQSQLAGDRYTKAYISALESGLSKPSMAALDYLAPRLGTTADRILANPAVTWSRLDADLALAGDDLDGARVAYEGLLDVTTEPLQLAEVELALAETLCRMGRANEAVKPAEDARRRFAGAGRSMEADRASYWLSSAHHQMDDTAEARRLLRDIVERTDLTNDPDFAVRVRIALGIVESAMGDYQRALLYLEEAADAATGLDLRRRGVFLGALARGRAKTGDFEGAIRAGTEAIGVFRVADAARDQARIENELALVYMQTGDRTRARGLLKDARAILAQANDHSALADIADSEARLALATGEPAQALELAEEARRRAAETGNHKAQFDGLITAGRALEALDRRDEALALYEGAAELVETDSGSPGRRREVYGAWADALAAAGRHADAYAVAKRALG